jgi:alanine racemase
MTNLLKNFPLRRKYKTLNQISVSADALKHNYQFFQKIRPELQIAPVLKSNAYGHGLVEVAKVMDSTPAKPPFIIVDSMHEAYALLKAHIKTPILLIGYTHPDNFKIKKLPFSTVVYDLETIKILHKHQPQMSLHLKIDTGMNRQGIRWDELELFLEKLKQFPHLKLEAVTTHLSDADNPDSEDFNIIQLKRFLTAIQLIKTHGYDLKYKHIAATAGLIKISHPEINMARLGLGLYGISPLEEKDKYYSKYQLDQLQPALKQESTLIQIKPLKTGETTSYNNTFKAEQNMTIGILPIGYNDGIERRLSNKGTVMIDDIECPILGRVCMNITVGDISEVKNPYVNQKVLVYSNNPQHKNSISNAAQTAGTIPYLILVHLSESTRRKVV